jgi:predicted nuclease with TOPRIM domain
MAFATVRVPVDAKVSWEILDLALRIEGETIRPKLETLCADLTALRDDYTQLQTTLTDLATKVDQLLSEALTLKDDTAPLWDDSYTLCGDPRCDGDCRVCQEGEEDYEDESTEKYCRRGKR